MGCTLLALVVLSGAVPPMAAAKECVVLLHGLARTARSMSSLEDYLTDRNYLVANIGYPSREKKVESLALEAIPRGLSACGEAEASPVHFVTHSMGGILLRYYLSRLSIDDLGRSVMIAPPNKGSEVVDELLDVPGFRAANGPAGAQLGTGPEALPAKLGPVDYPVGIIAGNKTINPLLSQLLPNPDDGKVSVESTRVEGMTDFRVVPASHTFIMDDEQVLALVAAFLREGSFPALESSTSSDASLDATLDASMETAIDTSVESGDDQSRD